MKRVILILGCVMLVLGMGSEAYAELGDTGADLIYTPVAPCRIIDTREPGAGGPIAGNATRNFLVTGTTGFESQGGFSGGCGIPEDVTSVMINFIAVGPPTGGHMRAWPYGGGMPNASIINFVPGLNIANGLIQPICNAGMTTCNFDLSIYAASDVNVVADVTGYFRRFPIEDLSALAARIAALEAKLNGLTRSGNDFIITNANLYIQSGSGYTYGTINGKGNLIIGYNESRGGLSDVRTGSHNLIVGNQQNYSSYGGMVVGQINTISAPYSSVSGGYLNTASGEGSSVSGGSTNTASSWYSSVSGGHQRSAGDTYGWVAGELWQDQ